MSSPVRRVVLHLSDGLRRLIDPDDVYFLEASEDETRVRLRGARLLVDVRKIGTTVRMFQPHGFQRIHREYAVNLRWVREVRRRRRGRDWEVKMEPPVHRVLPVSRSEWPKLEAALKRLGSQRRRGR